VPAEAVAPLDLALARRAAGVLPGDRRAPGSGTGTELAQLQPYEPGDDPRFIDPAASARTGVTHVRRHVPERAMTTWIVIDVSPSMAFGTGLRLKSDVAEGVAEVVGSLAVRRGGSVALVTAGAGGDFVLPPRSGRGALAVLRRSVSAGVAPDETDAPRSLSDALGRLRRLAKAPGLVVVVSDLREDGWERPLRGLARRHGVIAVEVTDPREASIPDVGVLTVVDPETGEQVEADTSSAALRRAYAKAEAERRATIALSLRRAGAAHVPVSTEGDWLRDLSKALR